MGRVTTHSKPDFIGIGPPKTGTTWIYKNLSSHPEVEMPPDKEIRYFWERVFIGRLTYRQRKQSSHWHHQARQMFCRERLESHRQSLSSGKLDVGSFWWDLKYTYGAHTDSWYASLFSKTAVSGDISAKYCELPENEIGRIKAAFPHLKILITLRNPVEREWSRAKMNLCKKMNRQISDVSDEEFIAQFNDPPQFNSNNYGDLIRHWEHQFGKHQVLILFYDELLEAPYRYFCKVCDFLNIGRPAKEEEQRLQEFVFKGVAGDIPERFKSLLVSMHQDHIEKLVEYLPETTYPKQWLDTYISADPGEAS